MYGRIAKLFKDPQSTDSDINLLLLGVTGTGKSTFINSIANYFKYPDFKSAKKGKTNILIPVRVNISHYNVLCGDPDKNESHEKGKSATQYVKVYLFPIKVDGKVFNLRIVDSPGVGDPRGIEQDNIHIDNILAYLATLKKLHGICFVMKANETRFTNFMEYCLKQILTRLDKSASDNIIFITTYSKIAQYTAGETKIHCLEPLVDNISSKPPHVHIPLHDNNVFALDNEAFKALLEMQEGKNFEKNEIEGFGKSWKISSQECRRLLSYIIGDARTATLKPHEVESTICINEVKFLVEQLATPIAEVSEVIQDNLRLLDRHKQNLNLETINVGQLKQQLYIPCVDLKVTKLSQPVTVCTDTKCAEVVKVNNVTEWHYKQKCHNPCYLTGIPREMIGDPRLTNCAAMNGTENCTQCGCSWRVHMHIYKKTEKIQTQKEDTSVRDAIRDKEDARLKIESLMKDLNKRMDELEVEGEIIAESVARFSFFLQEHALTPFNDAYSEYIKQLIKNEKSLGKFSDPAVIEKLQKLLQKHEHLQKTLQQNEQKFRSMGGQSDLTPQAIKNSINDLYKLKHMGAKIEELIRKSIACRNQETQKNFNCVVSQQVDLSEDSGSTYGGSTSLYYEDPRSGEYGSERSHGSSRSRHGPLSPTSEYYSEYGTGGRSEYSSSSKSRKAQSPSRSESSRHESERYYKAPSDTSSSRSVGSSRSKQYSGTDENESHKSPMSKYYSSKSTMSRRSSDSDNESTIKYVESSRSVASSRGTNDSGDDVLSKYESSSKSVRSTSSRQSARSTSSKYPGLDDEASVKYESSSKSVKSSRSGHPGSDDDKSMKYESSSKSVRSTSSRQPRSDDEASGKYESSSKSIKSSRSGHPGSDDDKSVKYESSSTSARSTRSGHPNSDHRSSTSIHGSRCTSVYNSDDDKSIRLSKSEYYLSSQKSDKPSRSRHTHDPDDDKSIKSSRSKYSTSGKSCRSQLALPDTDDNKSERSSRSSSKTVDDHSSRKSSSGHHKDRDTDSCESESILLLRVHRSKHHHEKVKKESSDPPK